MPACLYILDYVFESVWVEVGRGEDLLQVLEIYVHAHFRCKQDYFGCL